MSIDERKLLVVAGSTAITEPALILHALHEASRALDAALDSAPPQHVQLLCAPRKPEWFDGSAAELPGCVRRSRPSAGDRSAGLFLLDTIGELDAAYELADLVIVGRSFVDLFGSDPMAPAALAKPLVIGPNHADFSEPVRALQSAGGLAVVDQQALAGALQQLLFEPDAKHQRDAMGERARACVLDHQGATQRHAELLQQLFARG